MEQASILKPGDLVERFRIVKQLGAGGMGEVYLALDKKDYRNVALKVIKKGTPDFERMLAWFQREVELYRKIAHPNVVNFVAAGEVEGLHYVALEYIVGVSLRQWMNRNGVVELRRAFSWTQDLVFALHAAHQHDVIHRDIKPENIMVTRDETVKMIDFGLARVEGSSAVEEQGDPELLLLRGRPRDGRLSGDSGVVGTLSYLAPEVLLGRPVDARCDIYSLGLVFFEMLTGQLLVQDVSSAARIIDRHRQVDGMASFLAPPATPLGAALEGFVLRMLKSDPDARFASTSEMVAAMQALVREHGEALSEGDKTAGKRLAQQELVDTHFWQAMNLFAERRVEAAVEELSKILTFASSLDAPSKENIVRELDTLFYSLRVRTAEDGDDPYALERSRLAAVLVQVMRLYRAVAPEIATRLKMRTCLRRLGSVLGPAAYVEAVRSMVVDHPGDPLLMREFIRHLEAQNPGVARDVWLKFLRELLLKGSLREVREDILANVQVAGQSGDLLEILRNLVVLEREAKEEGAMAEELIAQLRRKQANEQTLTFCQSFLTKFPDCVPALEALIDVYQAEGRSRQVADCLASLGVVRYWRGERDLARQSFVASLDVDGRQPLAISYLCDMLDEEGRLGRVPHDRRAIMLQVYRVLGLYQPARRELERQLTETARDHEIYERIRELALESGHGDDVWECDFKMGGLRLKEGDFPAARGCYERALASAPDPALAADSLRRVPGIHKVYSIAELAQVGRRGAQPITESGGGAIDSLRRRVRDKNEE